MSPLVTLRLGCLVVFLLGLGGFLPILSFDFLLWDDDTLILFNEAFLQDWDQDWWAWAATNQLQGRYRFPVWVVWKGVEAAFGLNPAAFHALSWLLHALNGALVVLAIYLTGRALPPRPGQADRPGAGRLAWAAVLGGMAWALNPLRVEPVSWIATFPYLPAMAGMVGAWICLLMADRGREAVWLSLAGFLLLLSVTSYPMAVLLPAWVFLWEGFIRARGEGRPVSIRDFSQARLWKRVLVTAVPAFAVLIMTTYTLMREPVSSGAAGGFALAAEIQRVAFVLLQYVWHMVFPFALDPIHYAAGDFMQYAPWLWGLVGMWLLLAFYAALRYRAGSLAGLGWLGFLILMAPFYGLFLDSFFSADRYLYGAHFFLVACLVLWLAEHSRLRRQGKALIGAGLVYAAALAIACFPAFQPWMNNRTFFQRMMEDARASDYHASARLALGLTSLDEEELTEAESHFDEAIRIRPQWSPPRHYLGLLLWKSGRAGEAAEAFRQAFRIEPNALRLQYAVAAIRLDAGAAAALEWLDFAEPRLDGGAETRALLRDLRESLAAPTLPEENPESHPGESRSNG